MSKATGFVKEFRDFAVKGNAVDLAVGVIIGAAFGRIVDSLVKDIVMPLVNFVLGGSVDFSNKFLVLSMPEMCIRDRATTHRQCLGPGRRLPHHAALGGGNQHAVLDWQRT